MEEFFREISQFWETNKEWISPSLAALVAAIISWLTSIFRTRSSRLQDLIDGKNVYDDNDEVFIPENAKPGTLIPLGQLTIVRKGKNADEKKGD